MAVFTEYNCAPAIFGAREMIYESNGKNNISHIPITQWGVGHAHGHKGKALLKFLLGKDTGTGILSHLPQGGWSAQSSALSFTHTLVLSQESKGIPKLGNCGTTYSSTSTA